jgi:transmembrane sensor
MKIPHHNELRAVAEHASAWLEMLAEGAGPRERAAFAAWLTESPVHVREFLNMAALDRLLDGIDPERRMAVEGDRARPRIVPLAPQPARPRSPVTRRGRPALAAVFALLALGLGALVWWGTGSGPQDYATGVGDQSTVRLPDGSLVHLNTASRLEVRYSPEVRELHLLDGEALFTVERDSSRPFRVRTGETEIQALGTQFNVYRSAGGTRVSVIEGRIELKPDIARAETPGRILDAGDEARLSTGSAVVKVTRADLARVTAWRQRRLVFRSDTLEDIAAQFNRYNTTPRIRIDGEHIAQRRFTGVLDADKPLSLMRIVGQEEDLMFEQTGRMLVVRERD